VYWKSIDSFKDLEEVRKEFENRVDYEWGYIKSVGKLKNFKVMQLYVMKGYTANPALSGEIAVQALSGRGILKDSNGVEREIDEGEWLTGISGLQEVTSLENLKLQVYHVEA